MPLKKGKLSSKSSSKRNKRPLKKELNNKKVAQWLGQPVVVVMNDGSYYIGKMDSIERDAVTLSGVRSEKKLPTSTTERGEKVQTSGFLSSLFGWPTSMSGAGGSNLWGNGMGTGPGSVNGNGTGNGNGTQNGTQNGSQNGTGNGTTGTGLFDHFMPHIRIGMKMMKTIMPLMGLFKGFV